MGREIPVMRHGVEAILVWVEWYPFSPMGRANNGGDLGHLA